MANSVTPVYCTYPVSYPYASLMYRPWAGSGESLVIPIISNALELTWATCPLAYNINIPLVVEIWSKALIPTSIVPGVIIGS